MTADEPPRCGVHGVAHEAGWLAQRSPVSFSEFVWAVEGRLQHPFEGRLREHDHLVAGGEAGVVAHTHQDSIPYDDADPDASAVLALIVDQFLDQVSELGDSRAVSQRGDPDTEAVHPGRFGLQPHAQGPRLWPQLARR